MSAPSGVRVNAFTLADEYLRALGWPSTPITRRVLAAWFMRESPRVGKSDIIVRGWNPLNISCYGCSSYWLAGGGTHKIVIYQSKAQGIAAFARLIHGTGPGYSGIVKAFTTQSNDPIAIIRSINNSGWVTGKTNSYISKPGNNKVINYLLITYNDIGGADIPSVPGDATSVGSAAGKLGQPLTAFNGLVTYPRGYKLTEQDVIDIDRKLTAAGWFQGGPLDVAQGIAHQVFYTAMRETLIGKPWNEATLGTLVKRTGLDAAGAVAIPNALGAAVASPFQFLAGKALAIGALGVGVGLILFGAILVVKDVYSQGGSSIVSTTPIIVRE